MFVSEGKAVWNDLFCSPTAPPYERESACVDVCVLTLHVAECRHTDS